MCSSSGLIGLSSPGIAFDNGRNHVVLFGGKCGSGTGCSSGFYGLTWSWDGTSWTQLSVGTDLTARSGHRMAYDPNVGTSSGLYLFGGYDQGLRMDTTWYLPNTGNWTQGSTGPALRCCTGLAYDGRNAILTMFGGGNCAEADSVACNMYFNDTWTYDSGGWHCVGPVPCS